MTEHIQFVQFQQILAELQTRHPSCFPPAGVDLQATLAQWEEKLDGIEQRLELSK